MTKYAVSRDCDYLWGMYAEYGGKRWFDSTEELCAAMSVQEDLCDLLEPCSVVSVYMVTDDVFQSCEHLSAMDDDLWECVFTYHTDTDYDQIDLDWEMHEFAQQLTGKEIVTPQSIEEANIDTILWGSASCGTD